MNKIIAIANQKGGVGKTTTTVNLGIGLVNEGKKVLLIDCDAQGSLTESLGYQNPDKLEVTLSTLMQKAIEEQPIADGEGILHHKEGVDLVPANIELSGMETALVNIMSRERVLKSYIDKVKDNYDYVLIDCTPSLGMLTINSLAAADDNPGASTLSPGKRFRTAYHNCWQGKTANQPRLKNRRYSADNGGQADKLCKGYFTDNSHELCKTSDHLQDRNPTFHQGR